MDALLSDSVVFVEEICIFYHGSEAKQCDALRAEQALRTNELYGNALPKRIRNEWDNSIIMALLEQE